MARKKVKLAWISNDSSRRATFKKRNKGLMKKVSELSTLCAVTACAIVFPAPPPTNSSSQSHHHHHHHHHRQQQQQQPPEIWPPSTSEVKRVMGRFAELPHKERTKRMMNQEGFLRHTSSKLKEQVKRQQRENREQDMTLLMYQCLGGDKALHQYLDSPKDLHCLGTSVDHIINQVILRIQEFDYNRIFTNHHHRHHHQQHQTSTTTPSCSYYDHHIMMKQHDKLEDYETMNLDVAMEALQSQSWFKSIINSQSSAHDPPHQINYNYNAGDDDLEPLLWGY